MRRPEVIVVGAGVVGGTIARHLGQAGLSTLLYDCNRPLAGTPASGGHINLDWTKKLPKEVVAEALELISETWGLIYEQYDVYNKVGLLTGKKAIFRVDTKQVVEYKEQTAIRDEVVSYLLERSPPAVVLAGGEVVEGKTVILATGAFTPPALLGSAQLVGKMGVSFLMPGRLARPFLRPWAPYKQVVAHQQEPGRVWVGDGSALIESNWTHARTEQCLRRCRSAGPIVHHVNEHLLISTLGLRPYAAHPAHQPCLLRRVGNGWVVTGGGKMSTLAAGWAARRIRDELGV